LKETEREGAMSDDIMEKSESGDAKEIEKGKNTNHNAYRLTTTFNTLPGNNDTPITGKHDIRENHELSAEYLRLLCENGVSLTEKSKIKKNFHQFFFSDFQS